MIQCGTFAYIGFHVLMRLNLYDSVEEHLHLEDFIY